MRYTYSVAALSWIDPRSHLPVTDGLGNPGRSILRQLIVGRNRYRFANFLEAFVEVNAAGKITKYGFTHDSKMYYSHSAFGTKPFIYPRVSQSVFAANKVTFTQLVGCRTEAPEKAGEFFGGIASIPSGLPIIVSRKAGRFVAGKVQSFPPIWSDLELVINANGQHHFRVIRHSLFPSMSTYSQVPSRNTVYTAHGNYNGVPNLNLWMQAGWGMTAARPLVGKGNPGNPWGELSP